MGREYRPILTDLASGRRVLMRTNRGYTYTPAESESVRAFRVSLERPASALAVSAASARPTQAGAQITFALSTQATTRVEVLNIAGRLVATVDDGTPTPAGVVSRVWSGRSQAGTQVPAGQYLVRVVARTAEGQHSSAMVPLTLGR
jgi:hypothetical protein